MQGKKSWEAVRFVSFEEPNRRVKKLSWGIHVPVTLVKLDFDKKEVRSLRSIKKSIFAAAALALVFALTSPLAMAGVRHKHHHRHHKTAPTATATTTK